MSTFTVQCCDQCGKEERNKGTKQTYVLPGWCELSTVDTGAERLDLNSFVGLDLGYKSKQRRFCSLECLTAWAWSETLGEPHKAEVGS